MQVNADFGFSAQKTLDIAQKLYEMQYITYPRTTSRYLPLDLKPEVHNIIKSLDGDYKVWCDKIIQNNWDVTKPYFDDAKVESHFAIIPTVKNPVDISEDERKIYDLVAKSIIRAFYPDAIFNATTIHTDIDDATFVTKGSSLQNIGWMEVGHKVKEDSLVPDLKLGDIVNLTEMKLTEGKTKPPERYTDKTILSAMETAGKEVDSEELRLLMKDSGLGTPATRAGIIEKLIKTGYVERNKKLLIPTEKGMYLIDNLPCEELKSPEMTGVWEKRINDVERGKDTLENFIKDITEQTKKLCSEITKKSEETTVKPFQSQDTNFGKCPLCDGHVIKTKWGYGCSNYSTTKCGFSISGTICGKKLTETNIRNLLSRGTTGKINGFKSKAGNNFSATIKLIDGKTQFEF
jgi:DNA topoisomerase-3